MLRCPMCKNDTEGFGIVTDITLVKTVPLAKGGGVTLGGITVSQKDLKAAHVPKEFHNERNNRDEVYYECYCNNAGDPDTGEGYCMTPFWYFPSQVEGRPGRGLTHVGGKGIGSKYPNGVPGEQDPNEGDIGAEGEEVAVQVEEEAPPQPPPPPAPVARLPVRRAVPAAPVAAAPIATPAPRRVVVTARK